MNWLMGWGGIGRNGRVGALPLRGCSGTVFEGRRHLSRDLKEEPGEEYSVLILQQMQRLRGMNELGKFEEEKRGQY